MDWDAAQAWIAGGAAIVSVGAACFSLLQAWQARRQADAAQGNFAPSFFIEFLPDTEARPRHQFVAVNHNRHALLLEKLTLGYPANVHLVVQIPGTLGESPVVRTGSIHRAMRDGFTTHLKVTLKGLPPGGTEPAEHKVSFRILEFQERLAPEVASIQYLPGKPSGSYDLSYEVAYRILDDKGLTKTAKGRSPAFKE